MDKDKIRLLANKYNLPEEVVKAIVKSPYEFIRKNSVNFTSVRIPKLGLFVVKENRKKYIDERAGKKRD